jgi:hypothetical protein
MVQNVFFIVKELRSLVSFKSILKICLLYIQGGPVLKVVPVRVQKRYGHN